MIINRRQLVRDKVQQIMGGYSAYAESKVVAAMLKKELFIRKIDVYVDKTDKGFWFIPVTEKAQA